MKRLCREYTFGLTYDDRKFDLKNMREEDYSTVIAKQLNSMLVALRKKAKREKWGYEIIICPSILDIRTNKRVRLHCHVYIKGNPCSTIVKWIRDYWYKRYGIADCQEPVRKTSNLINYMEAQALLTKRQSENTDLLQN